VSIYDIEDYRNAVIDRYSAKIIQNSYTSAFKISQHAIETLSKKAKGPSVATPSEFLLDPIQNFAQKVSRVSNKVSVLEVYESPEPGLGLCLRRCINEAKSVSLT